MPFSLSKKNRSISFSKEIYSSNELINKKIYSIENTGFCRGYKIASVKLYPVRYRPKDAEVYYTNKINLRIELEKENMKSSKLLRSKSNDAKFIENIVENPETIETYNFDEKPLGNTLLYDNGLCDPAETYEYVVITNNTLRNTIGYDYNLSDLVTHRQDYSGLNSTIVTVEEIDACSAYWNDTTLFNDSQAHIREFCKDAYSDWNTEYIAIFGDWDSDDSHKIVPYRLFEDVDEIAPVDTMASDMYYSHLDTDWCYNEGNEIWAGGKNGVNDLYGELYVGRIACSNALELSNSIYKIINYDINSSYQNEWLRSVSFFGGDLGDLFSVTSKDYMEELRLGNDTHRTFTGFEEWNDNHSNQEFNTSERIYHEDIEDGYEDNYDSSIENDRASIINHLGHTNVNIPLELSNWDSRYNTKPFFCFSQGCLAGRFHDSSDSGCELLICNNKKRHAFGLVLNTGYGYGFSISTDGPSQYINAYFLDYFLNNQSGNQDNWQIGKAMLYAKDKMAQTISSSNHAWCYAWYSANLFGDPAQKIRLNNSNEPVQIYNENPLNNSVNISTDLSNLNCSISDSNLDNINWSIETNFGIGNNSGINENDGIKACSISNLTFSETYAWYVNATDGHINTNKTYYFTTRAKYIPQNPTYLNATSINKSQINISWTKANLADTVLLEYNTTSSSWERGQGIEIYNGTSTFFNHCDLTENTTYHYQAWSWNNTDNCWSVDESNISNTTLSNQAPMILNENPDNNSVNIGLNINNVSVYIQDLDDNFNYTIEGELISNIGENNSENGIKKASVIFPLNYNATYVWYVNATDNILWSNNTYQFTTRQRTAPNTPQDFNAEEINRTAINLTWEIDNNNFSYIEYNSTDSWTRGEGIEIYNDTGSNMIHQNLEFNTTYYYQIWSYNSTDNMWNEIYNCSNATTNRNHAPEITDLTPENNSVDVSVELSEISVRINDNDNDVFNWSIITIPDIGINNSTYQTNGTKTCSISDLSYETTYTIKINSTDSYLNTNKTFYFTTQSRPSNNNNNNNNPGGSYTPSNTNNDPIADANGPYSGIISEEITFDGSNSYDPDDDSLTYSWDFGDNNTGEGIKPVHKYSNQGNYTVFLSVTDSNDNIDTDTTYAVIEIKEKSDNNTISLNNTEGKNHDSDKDGIDDKVEEGLGSNKNNRNDTIKINIDNKTYYLIDLDNDSIPNIFYDDVEKKKINLTFLDSENILIYVDSNDKWDYKYNIVTNVLSKYTNPDKKNNVSESSYLTLFFILLSIVISAFIIVLLKKYLFSDTREPYKNINIDKFYNKKERLRIKIERLNKFDDNFLNLYNIKKQDRFYNFDMGLFRDVFKTFPDKKSFNSSNYDTNTQIEKSNDLQKNSDQKNYNKENFYDMDTLIDKKLKEKKKKQN